MKIRIIIAFLLAVQFACTTREGLRVHLKQGDNSLKHLLSVSYKGVAMQWQADTIAVVSWWDKQGDVHKLAVSEINGWSIEQQPIEKGYSLNCSHKQSGFSLIIELVTNDSIFTANITSPGIKETGENRMKSIRLLPEFGAAKEGEEGYLVSSKGVGTLCYFKDKEPSEYTVPMYQVISNSTMPLFGIVRGADAVAGIITSGQYDADLLISTNWGQEDQYSITPEFKLRSFAKENRLPEDLTVEYHFLSPENASWLGIAKCYRQYNFAHRGIFPLKQRIEKSPELAYSSRSMEVRLRLGVKPVPTPILEQTPENEPPVRVFLTFKQVRDIFDEFNKQGIKEAEFCLCGWNIGGHDGRYPQIFPVEPSLGGEEELRKTIAYGQSLGYQVAAHDDYYGAYRIAEDWDESYIRKTHDAQLWKGGQWGGGQSYNICLTQAYNLFALRDMPKIRELGFKGVHFSDVLSILGPRPCYDPGHPETRRQDAEATNRILSLARETFGGSQSEGSLDFAAPALDRFMYIHNSESSLLLLPYVDKCIPLYPVVYHGVLLYNLSNKTVNAMPGEVLYLKNIEYGSLPLEYFYSNFIIEGSGRKNWMGDNDYHYDSLEGLKTAVVSIKQVYSEFETLKHLQLEFIEGHKQLAEGVFETVYSNGESLVVNYNDEPYQLASGEKVSAKGFYLKKIT
jgi:hypothetical protein